MTTQSEAANQRNRERRASSCKFFSGFKPDGQCKAGVAYSTLVARLLPCIPAFKSAEEGQRPTCPHFVALGMDAVLAEDAEFTVLSTKTNKARAAVVEHFMATGKSADRIKCPVCSDGLLNYRLARSNGHIHAGCTTVDCVRWME